MIVPPVWAVPAGLSRATCVVILEKDLHPLGNKLESEMLPSLPGRIIVGKSREAVPTNHTLS